MSVTSDLMELREEDIRKHYEAAFGMLDGFNHTPRIAKGKGMAPAERSSGFGGAAAVSVDHAGIGHAIHGAARRCTFG